MPAIGYAPQAYFSDLWESTMPDRPVPTADSVLVKLRPSAALSAAASRVELRPLREADAAAAFGTDATPRWFVAKLPDGETTGWDLAHARLADQLGVSASDVMFAEPDLVHLMFADANEEARAEGFAAGEECGPIEQDAKGGKAVGPEVAWHLGDDFTQLARAREAVPFDDPRTRIAHIDTGYYGVHVTRPAHLNTDLDRNFVRRDGRPDDASDPDNRRLVLDNSGHGTGTLSILAGGRFIAKGTEVLLGGAPEAEVVPLRIADSVVLLKTSEFAEALHYAVDIGCDVGTMSMGGLPSRAWREAVDRAYVAGFCLVAAAGNNVKKLPTRHVVYPARYGRVITACGVMANGLPYTGLGAMQGNFGPDSVMGSAIAAYTPNIPWARFGCRDDVRLNGEGTSAATPQVAAAVALWFEKYKHELPRTWRRVEAVRHALFSTAAPTSHGRELGRGILRAFAALSVRPRLDLPQTESDRDSFAFLRVLTGLGIVEAPPREEMFNLEVAQRWLANPALQEIVPDPDAATSLDQATLRRFMDALIEDPGASLTLRRHVANRYPAVAGASPAPSARNEAVVPRPAAACEAPPALRAPARRRLQVYALDPSLSSRFDTAGINEVVLGVRWEDPLAPGPTGEYLQVDDVDASGVHYVPVDLDEPHLLARDGWAPSEGNPQFHQQMVYAVAMSTIEHFERALGRPVLWRHAHDPKDAFNDREFVRRLTVRPHALRQANAFYSPRDVALHFGYFDVGTERSSELVPGSRVYTCLSHDIIAHETTHAILDGMYRRFNEATNPDVLALHEGFADTVALLQHFTMPDLLRYEIGRTRGDIEAESLLGGLAVQFGRASGRGGALREAIGRVVDGKWQRLEADPSSLVTTLTPHARGAILVAAVLDAYIMIYQARVQDLFRIATGGTGILPSGAIHPDLVDRLTAEATKTARHVLSMCIRALDYLPPVDITFFEYLRAVITADYDLVTDDRFNYRLAFVEAFRRRGIHPLDREFGRDTPATMGADTLRWQGLDETALDAGDVRALKRQYARVVQSLKAYVNECFYLDDRAKLFRATWRRRQKLHAELDKAFKASPSFARQLGIEPGRTFEVHELRRAMRESPDGRVVPQVIVSLTQSTRIAGESGTPPHDFRGGSTLVVDLSVSAVKYRIYKNIDSADRRARTARFLRATAEDPLRALFFDPGRGEPFAALHALADEGS